MSLLRRLSLSRLILLCVAVVVVGASAAVGASFGGRPKPAPQPLASAIHDALTAPAVKGVSARINFSNSLLGSSGVSGSSPLANGATGRLWAAPDGRLRLELQSDRGDVQIVSDGQTLSYLDASTGTAYQVTLPAGHPQMGAAHETHSRGGIPTVAQIQSFLSHLAPGTRVSGATPDDVAGRPAYRVRIAPGRDGGLISGTQLWWDAVHGVPLRFAVYAAGRTTPVLELSVNSIHFGAVRNSVFTLPRVTKVVQVETAAAAQTAAAHAARKARSASARAKAGHARPQPAVTGLPAVSAKLPFTLSAPITLHGLPRGQVRLLGMGSDPAALVTYGQGLGGLAVIERKADKAPASSSAPPPPAPPGHENESTLSLPGVTIGGAHGTELVTPLGSVIQFQRGGVDYLVVGSVTGPDAEAAARGL